MPVIGYQLSVFTSLKQNKGKTNYDYDSSRNTTENRFTS